MYRGICYLEILDFWDSVGVEGQGSGMDIEGEGNHGGGGTFLLLYLDDTLTFIFLSNLEEVKKFV